jgi:CDP-glucose 4,6-dehydratase
MGITETVGELEHAYAGRRVLVTGHTGFKGSWLTLWLSHLGAQVRGYALAPSDPRGLFVAAGVEEQCHHHIGDVLDYGALRRALAEYRPEYVFHLAAQGIARLSYDVPLQTVTTNVVGTAHLLEAIRLERIPCAVVVVTSDKCYENVERFYGYREDEPLGGHDVYSMSKAAAELLVSSYRRSFFAARGAGRVDVMLCSARAGNVIGGGDYALDRIVPDVVRSLARGEPVVVRNPDAVRPWQHALDPLCGYLQLGARLSGIGTDDPGAFCEAWNFGPNLDGARPVRDLVDGILACWGRGRWEHHHDPTAPHEAGMLRLNIEKASVRLGWKPRWHFDEVVARTVEWYRAQAGGAPPMELRALCLRQIEDFEHA